MALDKIKAAMVEADVATTASVTAVSTTVTAAELDADKIQTNLAILAFKTAANGSLAKYNLQDQIVDEYVNATGVNAGDSTNEVLSSGHFSGAVPKTVTQDADATGTHGTYTWYKWTDTASTGSFTTDFTANYDYLVVAGGGGGARANGSNGGNGGAGAGGLLTAASLSVSAATYTITVGDGGVGRTSGLGVGTSGGNSSIAGSGITDIVTTGGGFGGASYGGVEDGGDGGSSGGASGTSGNVSGTSTASPNQGNDGGDSGGYGGSGGGGAGAVGGNSVPVSTCAPGGIGTKVVMGMTDANSTLFLAAASAGHSSGSYRYLAGGGGGATNGNGSCAGGLGGGGASSATTSELGTVGTDGTGGGAGGSGYSSVNGADGGSGIVIIRVLTADTQPSVFNNMTLQSSDTTAEAAPTKADIVMLVEDAGSGVASLNTSTNGLQAYISMYETGGTKTWTQATLTDEGDWGTDKRILVAHDVTLTGTSGTQMAYKITTHNASAVYDTRIHATSIGWR